MTDKKIKLEDIQWGQWYQVIIGFSKTPEIRTGNCIRSLIKTGASVTVLGPVGEIQDLKSYAYLNQMDTLGIFDK
jgi:hypothetical protein